MLPRISGSQIGTKNVGDMHTNLLANLHFIIISKRDPITRHCSKRLNLSSHAKTTPTVLKHSSHQHNELDRTLLLSESMEQERQA